MGIIFEVLMGYLDSGSVRNRDGGTGKAINEPKTQPLVRLPDTRRIIQTKDGLQEVVNLGAIVRKGGRG
jgi:hypothetical protein